MTKLSRLATLASLGLALAYPVSAAASPIVIQDGFVKAGLSDYGTLGSNDNTSPGVLYDPTGLGAYGVNDFLTPGTPWEGFYITARLVTGAPVSEFSNNTTSGGYHGGTSFNTATPTQLTAASGSWTSTSTDGLLSVVNTYTLTTVAGLSKIAINTTLTNLSNGALLGINFLRTTDPDPDVNAFGSFFTNNARISSNQACGTGPLSGQTICVNSNSPLTHNAGVNGTTGADAPWTRDPLTYLLGTNDGNGDYAIGVALTVGDLAAGGSVSFDYDYRFGATLDRVIDPPTVPEPATLGLLGMGLAGLVAVRRRRARR